MVADYQTSLTQQQDAIAKSDQIARSERVGYVADVDDTLAGKLLSRFAVARHMLILDEAIEEFEKVSLRRRSH